jgi:hypothetical protein
MASNLTYIRTNIFDDALPNCYGKIMFRKIMFRACIAFLYPNYCTESYIRVRVKVKVRVRVRVKVKVVSPHD